MNLTNLKNKVPTLVLFFAFSTLGISTGQAQTYPLCRINVSGCLPAKNTKVTIGSTVIDLKASSSNNFIHQSAGNCFEAGQIFVDQNSCLSVIAADYSTSEWESTQKYLQPTDRHSIFKVKSFIVETSGFQIRFNRQLNAEPLNIVDNMAGDLGGLDVIVNSSVLGNVPGSIVIDKDIQGFRFIAAGSLLPPANYTVTLVSSNRGIMSLEGQILDGNDDGVPGGNYTKSFLVSAQTTPVIGLFDFARGPNQAVDLRPHTDPSLNTVVGGLGIEADFQNLSVQNLSFDLAYDPSLLEITGIARDTELPAGATVQMSGGSGLKKVSINSSAALPNLSKRLIRFIARVPGSALLGQSQVIEVSNVKINDAASSVRVDSSVQLIGYVGDGNRSGSYTTNDVTVLQNVSIRYDSGFIAFPLINPLIIGDINEDGRVSAIDVTRLLQEVNYINSGTNSNRPEIPPIPEQ